jgi:hypothetical protein
MEAHFDVWAARLMAELPETDLAALAGKIALITGASTDAWTSWSTTPGCCGTG